MSGDINDTPEYILELRREKTANENKASALEFTIMRLQEDLSTEMHCYARLKSNAQRMRSSAETAKIELENALHERRILQDKSQALLDTIKLNEIRIATLKAERTMVHHSLYASLSESFNVGDQIKQTEVNNQMKTTPRTNTSEETRTHRRNTNDFLKLIENRDERLNTFVTFENKIKIYTEQTPPSTTEAALVTNYCEDHTEISKTEIQNQVKVDDKKHDENNQSMKNGGEEEEEGLTIANELNVRDLGETHEVSKHGDEVERGIPASSAPVSQLKDKQENMALEFKRVCTEYDEEHKLSIEAIPDSVYNELVNTELVNIGLVDTYLPEENNNTPEVLKNHAERMKKIELDTRQLESDFKEERDKLNIKTMGSKSLWEKKDAANQVQDESMFLSSPNIVGEPIVEGQDPKPAIHYELVRTRASLASDERMTRQTFARWLPSELEQTTSEEPRARSQELYTTRFRSLTPRPWRRASLAFAYSPGADIDQNLIEGVQHFCGPWKTVGAVLVWFICLVWLFLDFCWRFVEMWFNDNRPPLHTGQNQVEPSDDTI